MEIWHGTLILRSNIPESDQKITINGCLTVINYGIEIFKRVCLRIFRIFGKEFVCVSFKTIMMIKTIVRVLVSA